MRARSLARWLVVGALAVFAVMFAAGLAAAATTSAVQGQNGATGSGAVSGPVAGGNGAVIGAGPTAAATLGGHSQSQQFGDNAVTVNQSSTAKSGDAVAGSQVTGVVGGASTVQQSDGCIGCVAVSGPAVTGNAAVVAAGPSAGSILGSHAQAGQVGNNTVVVNQRSDAASGDALAGSQVAGVVGFGATVQNSNHALGALALSGPAVSGNFLVTGAGPNAVSAGLLNVASAAQVGNNDVVLSQSSHATTGDALAGSQVTGAVVGDDARVQNQNRCLLCAAVTLPAVSANFALVNAGPSATSLGLLGSNAQASQAGSNRVVETQEAGAATGDALAGSQVTGLVSSEIGNLTVQNQQSSDFDFAVSGLAVAVNVSPVNAGPSALAAALSIGVSANTQQIGDNVVAGSQKALASSGDALAGSQVTGIVGGSTATVQMQGHAFLPIAISGPAVAANVAPVNAGPVSVAFGIIALDHASTSQFGNNEVGFGQSVSATTGDALAGSQSTGVVVDGGNATVQNSNNAIVPIALSGPSVAANLLPLQAGPVAVSAAIIGIAGADVSQVGSNRIGVEQQLASATGDAVAGSQVTGVVAGPGGHAVVANQNASLLAVALTGPSLGLNTLAASVGPFGAAFSVLLPSFANASQVGDNNLLYGQDLDVSSGDGVSGSQISGVVAGIDPVQQHQNVDTGSLGISGLVVGANTAGGALGATALAPLTGGVASTQQAGSSNLGGSQDSDLESGDGVSGSQVTGSVLSGLAALGDAAGLP